jgi:hypothetical protein
MLHVFSLSAFFAEAIWYPHPTFTLLEISGLLDLAGLAAAIWTLWASLSLPLGGQLKRSYRCIAWGILAFAASHLLESFFQGTQILGGEQAYMLMQATVPASILFFVWGLIGISKALPGFSSNEGSSLLAFIWPLAVNLVIAIGAFSFILYGFSTQAEVVALIGLEGGLLILTGLCVFLLIKARLRGAIGRSLWLAMLGLLIFSLAHPLEIWLIEETRLSGDLIAAVHRVIVMPALILFAISITRLAHHLNQALLPVPSPAGEAQNTQPQKIMQVINSSASKHQNRERLMAGTRS